MRSILFLLLFLVIGSGCKEELELPFPENLIDEKKYVDVYIDLHLFNAMVQAVDTVMNEDSLRMALFSQYEINEEWFKSSHAYYQSQTQEQQTRLDTAVTRIARTLEMMNTQRMLSPDQLIDNGGAFRPRN